MAQKNWQIYLWRCSFCGSMAYGKKPPAQCSKCNSEANRHVLIPQQDQNSTLDFEKFLGIPNLYSFLYLVGSALDDKVNIMCCSSVTQISFYPLRVAVIINKNNLTHDLIKETGFFTLSPLTQSQAKMAHFLGRNSGRQVNKLENYNYNLVNSGCPVIDGCPGYYECEVEHSSTVEFESHTLFVARVIDGYLNINEPQLTYDDYKQEINWDEL